MPAEYDQIGVGVAAQTVGPLHTAGHLASGEQAGNGLARSGEHLRLGTDAHAAHGVVDGRDALGGVEGGIGHRVAQKLLAGRDLRVLAGGHAGVVALDGLGERRGIHADLGRQVLDSVGLEAVALRHQVGDLLQAVVLDVRGIHQKPHLVVRLLQDGIGDGVAGARPRGRSGRHRR